MRPKPDKIAVISTLIILSLISIPGVYAYYSLNSSTGGQATEIAQPWTAPEFQEESRIFDRRILLRKDRDIVVNKNRLVFRGIQDNRIRLDVYLLELDPDYAYPHYISMDKAGREFQLGESRFSLLDFSGKVLQLQILDLYKS